MPLISSTLPVRNVTICNEIYDIYDATATVCAPLWNVKNDLTYVSNYTLLATHLANLNYANNITNVINSANSMLRTLASPPRSPLAPSICTIDYHCNYNGKCTSI